MSRLPVVAVAIVMVVAAGFLAYRRSVEDPARSGTFGVFLASMAIVAAAALVAIAALAVLNRRRWLHAARQAGVQEAWPAVLADPRGALQRVVGDRNVLDPRPRYVAVGISERGIEIWGGWLAVTKLGSVPWSSVRAVETGSATWGSACFVSLRFQVQTEWFDGALDLAPLGRLLFGLGSDGAVRAAARARVLSLRVGSARPSSG